MASNGMKSGLSSPTLTLGSESSFTAVSDGSESWRVRAMTNENTIHKPIISPDMIIRRLGEQVCVFPFIVLSPRILMSAISWLETNSSSLKKQRAWVFLSFGRCLVISASSCFPTRLLFQELACYCETDRQTSMDHQLFPSTIFASIMSWFSSRISSSRLAHFALAVMYCFTPKTSIL
jgi:hypothetical protein